MTRLSRHVAALVWWRVIVRTLIGLAIALAAFKGLKYAMAIAALVLVFLWCKPGPDDTLGEE